MMHEYIVEHLCLRVLMIFGLTFYLSLFPCGLVWGLLTKGREGFLTEIRGHFASFVELWQKYPLTSQERRDNIKQQIQQGDCNEKQQTWDDCSDAEVCGADVEGRCEPKRDGDSPVS